MRIRVAIALSVMFLSGCAMTSGPAPSAEGAKTRAEVRADLAMWKRAGMDKFYKGRRTPDIYSASYRKSYANYLELRNGPEYQEELNRLKGEEQ